MKNATATSTHVLTASDCRKTDKKLYSYICLLRNTLVVERLFLDAYLRQNVDFTVDPVHGGSNTEEVKNFTD